MPQYYRAMNDLSILSSLRVVDAMNLEVRAAKHSVYRVLDWGCGDGTYSNMMADAAANIQVTCLDQDQEFVKQHPRVLFVKGIVTPEKGMIEGGPYDFILLSAVIHL